MIGSKRIGIVVAAAMAFALLAVAALYILGGAAKESGALENVPAYASEVFGADIISIEILTDEADWQEMLDNAISEQFIMADVIVNGTKFQDVGVRPKGNSSLTQVASSESDRYSLRLQFDEYISGQTCFGLQSLVLNNMLGDNTYMKEYISYDLMQAAGINAPCFGFADIQVNGEAWGLYLAVELYNESYEQRVSGDTSGMLYNVKSMDMGGNDDGDNAGFNAPAMREGELDLSKGGMPDGMPAASAGAAGLSEDQSGQPALPDADGETRESTRAGGMARGGGMGGMGSGGGSLAYTDDNSSSYSAIFNNVVGKGTQSDYQKVIEALKALSEGRELEAYFDVDQILRYFAAHTFVVNLDSYSSGMAQNYYLYELDGKLAMLPWDYNLAWGGFQSGDAASVVNFPIDTPVSGVEMAERPLLDKLLSNAEYLETYHGYLQQLVDDYFSDGKFAAKVKELDVLIGEYVKNDSTAFCTYEEYEAAVEAFITLGDLRAQSVEGQLVGSVPSTTAAQDAYPELLVSAQGLDLSTLGSMMGGRGGDMPGAGGDGDQSGFAGMGGNMPDGSVMRQAMEILQQAGGELTDEAKEKLAALGLTEEQIQHLASFGSRRNGGNAQPDGNAPGGNAMPGSTQAAAGANGLLWTAIATLCLLGATGIIAKTKRKF
ncbi:MAG: CotH kinase family protein [Candidatus Pelethousia sp.]|nr:CotH kinase family protein [Candidatus Pelethousia sp.]